MHLTSSLAAALTAGLLILGTSPAALANASAPHERIADLAEQSRMLAPRATKAYLMVQQGISPEAGRRLLAESVSRLDQNLAALRSARLDETTRAQLNTVETRWNTVRTRLTATPDATGAKALYDDTEALQTATQHLAMAINSTGSEDARRLTLPARMRLLSQRIGMFYLYRDSGLMTPNAPTMELSYARSEFSANLVRIRRNEALPAETRRVVEALNQAWSDYDVAAGKPGPPGELRKNAPAVMEMSEQVLGATEKLVVSLLGPSHP
ncbi:type IV pili methyl-accepting chemotaxis transducer N-terminal domain-containing protein [Zoogloea sp.]|uniref:type IV pili methyl-accepting chemotaxis transducer N-terminal domain-containing protein n=1 Tax=Zoogloea sp. TaxID=49181 RepID=UPI0026344733|nr:type IV pili methyl-accepting chemotaxis transducer N-terminal domain-containing protein [Zoogloea sp.]MDD3353863.1 type IV pili methyl-accepting chemotaxis transducer N-terminal domain-containing protein [Zoogloea sp.]